MPERFADRQLQEFYQEFMEHKDLFEAHRAEQQALHNELLAAIRDNTTAVVELANRSRDMLEAWEAAKGAVSIFRLAGNVLKWAAGVGAVLLAAYHFLMKS